MNDTTAQSCWSTIPEALDDLRLGKFLIVCDDEDRENEGDLIMPCELATEEALAFMVNYTSGVICVGMNSDRCERLQLPPMVSNNEDPKETAFTVTVDYKIGTTTGISAADRALTIRKLADPKVCANEFTRPGHIFPLKAVPGGVLRRGGHTEASVDLSRLAGCQPTGFLSEIVCKDGTMMRRPDLELLSKEFNIKMITIEALKKYILETEGDFKGDATKKTFLTKSLFSSLNKKFNLIGASIVLGVGLGYVLSQLTSKRR
jgi:3,4-dihydroxy 2-butanone 4-phosphate synthase/GTP cyclohydrolase II|tara:strand:+ start:58 stop:840 length:783 start_codon:yes stop_codon:yes gene_type:complete